MKSCYGLDRELVDNCIADQRRFSIEGSLACQKCIKLELVGLENLAYTDELTGLGNRRAALKKFDEISGPKAVGLIDLTSFKRVNDVLGQEVGDTVLEFTASFMGNFFKQQRDNDDTSVYRLGGDEFVIIHKPTVRAEHQMPLEKELDGYLNRLNKYYQELLPIDELNRGIEPDKQLGMQYNTHLSENESFNAALRCIGPKYGFTKQPYVSEHVGSRAAASIPHLIQITSSLLIRQSRAE